MSNQSADGTAYAERVARARAWAEHDDGCWRRHLDCAVVRIRELERSQQTISESTVEPERAVVEAFIYTGRLWARYCELLGGRLVTHTPETEDELIRSIRELEKSRDALAGAL